MSKTPEEIAAEQAATEAAEKVATDAAEADAAAAATAEAATKIASATKLPVVGKIDSLVVNIAGTPTSDPKAIQTYIASLEGFQKETQSAARKNFVAALASGDNPKIGATQIDGLEKFVASLSDTQYGDWTKTWDAAVTLPLLGKHGAGSTTNLNGDGASQEADRLAIVQGTVRQHKLSGMDPEQIKLTASYNELMKLNPTFTL